MTGVEPGRLRRGEIVAGACGGALLTFTLGLGGGETSPDGSIAGQTLVVMAAGSGLALTYLQATRRAPALPVTVAAFVTPLGAAATTVLARRLVRRRGGRTGVAVAAVMAAAGLTVGGFLSLRQEDGWVPDAAHPVELIDLDMESAAPAPPGAPA